MMVMRRMGGIAAALALFGAAPLAAQYFGKNKVQYQAFDFKIIQTEHFEVYYYPALELVVRPPVPHPAPPVPGPEADHLVRLAVGFPADEHH